MDISGIPLSQCWVARLQDMIGIGRRVGFVLYQQHEGISFVGTIGYITQYINIGTNFDAQT